MIGFALKFMVLWGWRRVLVAAIAGLVCALAAPPIYFLPALLIGLTSFVWILDGVRAASDTAARIFLSAFAAGWAFGFGYFAPNLYWVSEAFLVEADTFAWMIPFVVVLFPAALGLFHGMAAAAAMLVWSSGLARIAALAICMGGAEWLRGHIFTGFPWAVIGYAGGALDGLEQLAAYVGLYGLSVLVVFLCAAPAVLAEAGEEREDGLAARALTLALVAALGCGLWVAGNLRLAGADTELRAGLKLRIVQPNIPQAQKWDPRYRRENFDTLLELSDMAATPGSEGVKDVSAVIWPESSIPFLLEANPAARHRIAQILPDDVVLVTGALRLAVTAASAGGGRKIRNSALALDSSGATVADYDKFHLVPFGEYLPWAAVLEPMGLRKLVTLPSGFVAGSGPAVFKAGRLPPASVLICYEVIFPGSVTVPGERPEWLLNLTNDAWFGSSIGPRQHLAQARMRAIEEGLPLVRAANTGISAVVDSHGRVIKALPLNVRGVLDSRLPAAISPTPYTVYGDLFFFAVLILGFSGLYVRIRLVSGRAPARIV
ncbi:MAG: apolipoprotein N-acyltransferase [Pseudomonadota bacterium]